MSEIKFYSRSHDAVIRVYNGAANVIETHERAGGSKRGEMSRVGSDRGPHAIKHFSALLWSRLVVKTSSTIPLSPDDR